MGEEVWWGDWFIEAGEYPFTLTATNVAGTETVEAVLRVFAGPVITSADSATFTAGRSGSFTITTSGYPRPSITIDGELPAGLTLVDRGDGTAELAGTPTRAGTATVTITAANSRGQAATQELTIDIAPAPVPAPSAPAVPTDPAAPATPAEQPAAPELATTGTDLAAPLAAGALLLAWGLTLALRARRRAIRH